MDTCNHWAYNRICFRALADPKRLIKSQQTITLLPERYTPAFYKYCAGILIALIAAAIAYTLSPP